MLEAESTEREIRTIRYQINAAKFPVHRNLLGFDFNQSTVDESLISRLATMEFTDAAQNLVLVGGTGTGKTHLATAIGVSFQFSIDMRIYKMYNQLFLII